MGQPPFRSDSFRIENADAPPGDREVYANELTGSLMLKDPFNPTGVSLSALSGLSQAQNTIIVSPNGTGGSVGPSGQTVSTIQQGLDAVPTSSNKDNPWLVLVAPGLYVEDLYVVKDGVTLCGLGRVVIRNSSNTSTIRVLSGGTTTPKTVTLSNLQIECSSPNESCIDLSSAMFASGAFSVLNNPNVGDAIEIGGVVLTAVSTPPAPGEYLIGVDEATTALNLSHAIMDPINGLNSVVIATPSASVVIIRASNPGPSGNAITLSSATPLSVQASSPNLTGGTASQGGSFVGQDAVRVINCGLVAGHITSFQIRAVAVNNVLVQGGSWEGSFSGSACSVSNCSSFRVVDQAFMRNLAFNYDSSDPILPFNTSSSYYSIEGSIATGSYVNVGLQGTAGEMVIRNSSLPGALTFSGSAGRTLTADASQLGPIAPGGTSPGLVLRGTSRGPISSSATGTLWESTMGGEIVFSGQTSVFFTFAVPQPDTNYTVTLEPSVLPNSLGEIPYIPPSGKGLDGFSVQFGSPQTATLRFNVVRTS